jgi:hypothetical protein
LDGTWEADVSEAIGIAYLIIGGIVAGAELHHQRSKSAFSDTSAGFFVFSMVVFWLLWPLVVGAWLSRYWRLS